MNEIEILQRFKEANPWHGKIRERKAKFERCFEELKAMHNMKDLKLEFDIANRFSLWHDSGSSSYNRDTKIITLRGRLSVVTFLHEFAHALFGSSEERAREFSLDLFKKVFPEKYARCNFNGIMLTKPKLNQTGGQ
jgi:hypothetical protein